MEDGQGEGGKDDHRTIEYHKGDLLVGQRAIETLAQFCHTEAGSDEDENSGNTQGYYSPVK